MPQGNSELECCNHADPTEDNKNCQSTRERLEESRTRFPFPLTNNTSQYDHPAELLMSFSMTSCQGYTVDTWVGLFEAHLRKPSVSVKFELRYESLKEQIQLILFAYNLIIGY